MNKTIKRKWIKALRSGRYRQAKHELKSAAGAYCCLGVLCNVLGAKWRRTDDGCVAQIEGKNLNHAGHQILRSFVLKEVGLTGRKQGYLARLNDGDKYRPTEIPPHNFKQIADYIERRL